MMSILLLKNLTPTPIQPKIEQSVTTQCDVSIMLMGPKQSIISTALLNTGSSHTFIEVWQLLHQASFEEKPMRAVQQKTKEGVFAMNCMVQVTATFLNSLENVK
jgi:hypothetical protein